MLPDRVSNPGPLTYESDALPIALRGPATWHKKMMLYPCTLIAAGLIYCLGNLQIALPVW